MKKEIIEKNINKSVHVILDVAHNAPAVHALFQALHLKYPSSRFRVVAGFSGEKDVPTCLRKIVQNTRHIHLVRSSTSSRALPIEEVCSSKFLTHSFFFFGGGGGKKKNIPVLCSSLGKSFLVIMIC